MDSGGKIIAAFLAGAAAGASLGLLLAPDRGDQTRQRIRETFEDVSDKAQEQFEKVRKRKQPEIIVEDED